MSSEPFATSAPLEPKLYFANERTFLHWLHACLTLASVGMVLTSAADRDNPMLLCIGVALSGVSLFLMWYAYRTFLWRMARIRSRAAERADDPVGPIVISASVVVALAASAMLAFSSSLGPA
ncbi:hypothetical protein EMIHUDRAFT_448824 [Emiliania huxleyi CCMP1516]|uniref:DUF202 domain-containing protein n=2 Tax=Emiliania huxleyi TaxID=2903 RepID=A0A0D3I5S4_EMIH1|nr:hypothetical protein EMIHUDRAFT_465869 [Emiliania huxleyi CCMP1516]XP_005791881.1 hypothetical protein EMIHUDRAFT_448824 [Emiliania huxleyi CCMP1516]EOD06609.1 hypothetical protein EMIHUDRAFT_465869 [Emiliania huxleyi CCMP1516]EOD39452.1 hypothetical protein EMIHUDRAFT_448824 [Emiliania huxleyi CCMP1516]|eukprot:XP_005759038.1 hypothetical protein EMIHUDRAFT_465869 [Emiliania huxleyi CCMP1516]